jgi:hypothetical protein
MPNSARACDHCGRWLGEKPDEPDKPGEPTEQLSSTVRVPCPQCGQPNRPGAAFCAHCRAALDEAKPVAAQICPRCGAENVHGQYFCDTCGTPLAPAASASAVAPTKPRSTVPSPPLPRAVTPPAPPSPPLAPPRVPPLPRRGVPGWVWGFGGVLVVVAALAVLIVIGAIQLSGLQSATSTPEPSPTSPPSPTQPPPTAAATETPTPSPTPTPTATPTPDLTAAALAACVFDLEVIEDRPVWPGVLMPGQRFVKRWEIKNTGTCAWPEGVQLIFASGDELEVVEKPEIKPLLPEETLQIETTLQAPAQYGTYASVWQVQDAEGNPIREELKITCRVGPTPTPTPTATPTPTPTPEFSPTPMEPLHFSVPIIVDWHGIPDGKYWARAALTAGGGDGNYRYFQNYVSAETEFFNGTFEYEAQTGQGWVVTVIVQSGDGQEKIWKGIIPYPG